MRTLIAFLFSMLLTACTSPGESTAPAQTPETELSTSITITDGVSESIHQVRVAGVQLQLSSAMRHMTEQEVRLKYPQVPLAAFTDSTTSVNLVVNHLLARASQTNLRLLLSQFAQQVKQGGAIVEWEREEVTSVGGRKIAVMEFVSQAIDTRIYNLMFFTDIEDRLWVASYNCTVDKMDRGKAEAWTILQSLTTSP